MPTLEHGFRVVVNVLVDGDLKRADFEVSMVHVFTDSVAKGMLRPVGILSIGFLRSPRPC